NPPAPVEGSPPALPHGAVIAGQRRGVEAVPQQLLEVQADRLDEFPGQEQRSAGDRDDEQQDGGQAHVDVGQPADALLDPGDHGHGRHQRDGADQDDVNDLAGVAADDLQEAQTGTDLQDAKAERGGHTEQRPDDGRDVDDVTDPALDLVAEDRLKRPADGDRPALA